MKLIFRPTRLTRMVVIRWEGGLWLAGCGSPLYALIWKHWGMPAGPPICALRASARRTSDNGCGGWPTATAHDAERGGQAKRAMGEARRGKLNLQDFAMLAGWPTPCQQDGPKGGPSQGVDRLPGAVAMAGWATPRVTGNGSHGSPKRATDGRARLEDQVHGAIATGSPASTGKRGQLNPAFSRWLMGFPAEWDDCAPTATPSSRRSRPSS